MSFINIINEFFAVVVYFCFLISSSEINAHNRPSTSFSKIAFTVDESRETSYIFPGEGGRSYSSPHLPRQSTVAGMVVVRQRVVLAVLFANGITRLRTPTTFQTKINKQINEKRQNNGKRYTRDVRIRT